MKKLEVYYNERFDDKRLVGQLAELENKIYFEYDASFLQNPLWLSPFKLPPEAGLIEHRDLAFGPLFGLFDDSLPDGWGLLLMDRYFQQHNFSLQAISPLDRLAYLGTHTMGALTYYPPSGPKKLDKQLLNLHNLAEESYNVLEGKSEHVLEQLIHAGGSPGGARPKVLVGVCGEDMISGEDELPQNYSAWIVKFHSHKENIDDGRIEFSYSQLARKAGIEIPETRLFTTKQGEAFFGVKRFDRHRNQRLHVHTFGNLIHANFRIPSCDYNLLLKVTRVLTKQQKDVLAAFRLMVFNILVNNRDDHVKNFAFILDFAGNWHFAPAYDLTYSPGPGGEHTMTVAGEGKKPTIEHIMNVAKVAGISHKQVVDLIDEVAAAVATWQNEANANGVSKKLIKSIDVSIQGNLKRIQS